MVPMSEILLRINGTVIEQPQLRRGTNGSREVVVVDKLVGEFTLHEDFAIEVARAVEPWVWQTVTYAELAGLLQDNEAFTRAVWLHDSDVVDGKAFGTVTGLAVSGGTEVEPFEDPLRKWEWSLRKAERALYAAGVPYLLRADYATFRDLARHTDAHAFDLFVPDPEKAHAVLCGAGFRPHPSRQLVVIDRMARVAICLLRKSVRSQ